MIEIRTKKLKEHLYRFEEYGGPNQVHVYLICGAEKALMIDGLWLAEGLLTEADRILKTEYKDYAPENRNKKLKMLITHGHEDHAGKGMEEFLEAGCTVYVSAKDWPLLNGRYESKKSQIAFLTEEIMDARQSGCVMDLGGVTVQIIQMPGHTPGSLLAWVPKWNTLFASDAIGAGVLWMQLPECRPLDEYGEQVRSLLRFLEEEKGRSGTEVEIYPGHAQQILSETEKERDVLSYAYVKEVLELTEKILDNPQIGQPKQIDYPGLEHVRVRSVGEKLLYDYCYDEDWENKCKADL